MAARAGRGATATGTVATTGAGGYWHGVFWPHVWFNPGYAWFLPVLPLGYATFWWGGVPYYYWNNVYYTWSPGDNGYVVTDPPPAAGENGDVNAVRDGGQYAQADAVCAGRAAAGHAAPPAACGCLRRAAAVRTSSCIRATARAKRRRRTIATSATAGR